MKKGNEVSRSGLWLTPFTEPDSEPNEPIRGVAG
jgi:hypothetical protein